MVRPMNTIITRDRFQALALALLAVVVVIGFARTYYLRVWFDLPPLTRVAHIHGVLWTLWLALHYTQARLVAAHRADLHRKLGIFGALLGAVLVVTSADLSIEATIAGRAPPGRIPLQFLSVSLGASFMFGVFLTAALALRRHREWHKRLMFLASVVLVMPAVGRLDVQVFRQFGTPPVVVPFLATAAFVAWAWVNDWRKHRAIHPAYLYGGVAVVAAIPARFFLGFTDGWMQFARWLTS
jgi:hypothetical protein